MGWTRSGSTSSTRRTPSPRRRAAGPRSRSSITDPPHARNHGRASGRGRLRFGDAADHSARMTRHKLAILVGGGPAPGINSVIAAATIRARLEGVDVLGVEEGFEWLMQGDTSRVRPLSIDADRKSKRLNSSHYLISHAVFCLKKKTIRHT